VRSFARIHETNLKKQGVLPLTFADPADYDQIGEDDRISVLGLADLAPDQPVRCRIHKPDGTTVDFEATHTLSPSRSSGSGPAAPSTSSACDGRAGPDGSTRPSPPWPRAASCAPWSPTWWP
jgi:hypothetical protein